MDIAPTLTCRGTGKTHEHAITFGWLGKLVAGSVVTGLPALTIAVVVFGAQMKLQVHDLSQDVSELLVRQQGYDARFDGAASLYVLRSEAEANVKKLEQRIESLEQQIVTSSRHAEEDREQIKNLIRQGAFTKMPHDRQRGP